MKLMPASSARWMIEIDLSWSVSPQAPNIIAPRQSGLTWTPVVPRLRISIGDNLHRTFARPARGNHRGGMRQRLRLALAVSAIVLFGFTYFVAGGAARAEAAATATGSGGAAATVDPDATQT